MPFKSDRDLFIELIDGFNACAMGENRYPIGDVKEFVDQWIDTHHITKVLGPIAIDRSECIKSGCKKLTTTCDVCGRVTSTASFPDIEEEMKKFTQGFAYKPPESECSE